MIVEDNTLAAHEVRAILSPNGLDGAGQIVCVCGWIKSFERLSPARARHARHALNARLATALRRFA